MKGLRLFWVLVLLPCWSLAMQDVTHLNLPKGYPTEGELVQMYDINTDRYEFMVDGIRTQVFRAVKVITPKMNRIFLFQIPDRSSALLIRDNNGIVVEIWLLPEHIKVPLL